MSTYRYMATNLLSGVIVGDWLPITPTGLSRTINTVGTFTGALSLAAGNSAQENRAYLAAVEPEKSVLWVFQDQAPVWVGILWDQPHQSVLDNTMPLSASTPESLFSHRQISDDLVFTDVDIFDLFRSLATYALSKTPNGAMAGFTMGSNQAGITTSITYNATDLKLVFDAMTDLISAYDFEYSVRPAIDPTGNVYMVLDLAFPELGLPLATAGLTFNLPGNLIDYAFPRTGSTSSNRIVATASASGTLSALNANSDFETTVAPWTGANGAPTPVVSTAWSSSGSQALSFHGNGSTHNPLAQTEHIPVQGGVGYSFTPTLWSAAGFATNVLNVTWYDASVTAIATITCAAIAVAASTATPLSISGSAPASAVSAVAQVEMLGNPASSTVMLVDDAVFTEATPSSGNWISALPHGQDDVALDAGYPLLESSASLSTITVAQQSQIDSYADGLLPAVTGTQATPLLVLGGGQKPAVKDMTLGSYCQFNATSPVHPARDDGSPGLQVTGRVVGWTLTPSTATQAESTSIQLGQLEVIS